MQRDKESGRQSARERRLARDDERERVRSALRFAAQYGYYVFDELVTERAGTLDYLAVGPPGATAVIVRDDEGVVIADPYTYQLYVDGYPFEDDPRQQRTEQADDIVARLTRGDVPVGALTCFTRAELRDSREPDAYIGIATIWTLPWAFDKEEENFNPAEVADIADDMERIYGRPPFVKPLGERGGPAL